VIRAARRSFSDGGQELRYEARQAVGGDGGARSLDGNVLRSGADGIQLRRPDALSYLGDFLTFRNGKLHPNDRPGLGVTVDFKALTEIASFDRARPTNVYRRPDGSLTHW